MSGFSYLINLNVINGGAFGKLSQMASSFEQKLDSAQGEIDQTAVHLDKMGRKGKSVFDGMKSSVGGWIAGLGIAAATLGSLSTTADISSLDTAITFAGGAQGVANLAHVESTAARLNTPLMAAKEGFKVLTGSMIGTNITALQQRDIFDSVAVASRVMGLSADNTTGAILALGQMASKGKVQAEELRGQLGERIPGAFGIAARAMGVTTVQLDKMMEQGKLVAEDFLPKFAAEMQKTFGPGLEAAMNSPRAQFDKFGNSILTLKETIGTQLMPTATALINDVLVPMVGWIGQNIELLGGLVTVFGSLYIAAKLYNIITGIQALVTGGFTGSIWGLNAAMLANPITWVVAGFVALTSAIVYAWNKSEGFRGFLFGMWETIKTFASLLIDRFVKPVIGAFQILKGAWNGSTDEIQAGMNTLNESANAWSKDFGGEMGSAFERGVRNGINDFKGVDPRDAAEMARDDRQKGWNDNFRPIGAGGAGGAAGGKGTSKATDLSNSISGGGQRNITINVGKLNDGGITINTTNLREGAQEIETMLIRMLAQVVNSPNQMQTN